MRKIWISVFAALLAACFAFTGCVSVMAPPQETPVVEQPVSTPEPEANIKSPVTQYADFKSMSSFLPDIHMSDAPKESANIVYQSIDNADETADIAEILFSLNGVDYSYRACVCPSLLSLRDISGLYYDFDVNETVKSNKTGVPVELAVSYCTPSGIGHVTWFDPDSKCEYNLSGKTNMQTLIDVSEKLASRDISLNSVQGVVTEIDAKHVKISTDNGNVLNFPLSVQTDAKAGDTVLIKYSGTVGQDDFLALSVTVTEEANSYVGEIIKFDSSDVIVANGNTAVMFSIEPTTKITGKLENGAIVSLIYTGKPDRFPKAVSINVEIKPEPHDDSLINKTLKGRVTKLNSNWLYIETAKGKNFKFERVRSTKYVDKYDLEVGCTVRVTYDGYASDAPEAKKIQVLDPAPIITPEPTIKPVYPEYYAGTIIGLSGMWIVMDDGNTYTLDTSYASIHDFQYCEVGNLASITFFRDHGERIITDIDFTFRPVVEPEPDPDPDPDPVPVPDPDPDPVPDPVPVPDPDPDPVPDPEPEPVYEPDGDIVVSD